MSFSYVEYCFNDTELMLSLEGFPRSEIFLLEVEDVDHRPGSDPTDLCHFAWALTVMLSVMLVQHVVFSVPIVLNAPDKHDLLRHSFPAV